MSIFVIFLAVLVCRKRPNDASTAEFDSAVSNLFQTLTNVSREFLTRFSASSSVIGENDYDFAECLCESMASLGSTSLQCISSDNGVMAAYLQQVRYRSRIAELLFFFVT